MDAAREPQCARPGASRSPLPEVVLGLETLSRAAWLHAAAAWPSVGRALRRQQSSTLPRAIFSGRSRQGVQKAHLTCWADHSICHGGRGDAALFFGCRRELVESSSENSHRGAFGGPSQTGEASQHPLQARKLLVQGQHAWGPFSPPPSRLGLGRQQQRMRVVRKDASLPEQVIVSIPYCIFT